MDPLNANLKAGLEQAEAKMSNDASTLAPDTPSDAAGGGGFPNLSSLASMFGGGGEGGGGEGGGMPNLAGLMNNPTMRQMAQNLMASGGLDRLMQNPAVANMVFLHYIAYSVGLIFIHIYLVESSAIRWRYAFNAGIDVRS